MWNCKIRSKGGRGKWFKKNANSIFCLKVCCGHQETGGIAPLYAAEIPPLGLAPVSPLGLTEGSPLGLGQGPLQTMEMEVH